MTNLLGSVADQLEIMAVLLGNVTVPCSSVMILNGNIIDQLGNMMVLLGNITVPYRSVMNLNGTVALLLGTVYKNSQFRGWKSGKISITVLKQVS